MFVELKSRRASGKVEQGCRGIHGHRVEVCDVYCSLSESTFVNLVTNLIQERLLPS
jgi:hypothetical protein